MDEKAQIHLNLSKKYACVTFSRLNFGQEEVALKKILIISLLSMLSLTSLVNGQTTLFWDATTPERIELTTGMFSTETLFSDWKIYPFRLHGPFSEKSGWFVQANYISFDLLGFETLDTYEIGAGFSYQFKTEDTGIPFNLASRCGASFIGEFEGTDSSDIFLEGGLRASKTFDIEEIAVVPYVGLTLGLGVEDTDTTFTSNIGCRFKFQSIWSVYLQHDQGDRDGFSVGGSYAF